MPIYPRKSGYHDLNVHHNDITICFLGMMSTEYCGLKSVLRYYSKHTKYYILVPAYGSSPVPACYKGTGGQLTVPVFD